MMTNKSSLAALAAGVFNVLLGSLMLGLVPCAVAAAPMLGYPSALPFGSALERLPVPVEGQNGWAAEIDEAASSSTATESNRATETKRATETHVPALARDITIQGCLEFSEIIIPGAFVIWCRPCDQICIVILQPGVDDRSVFSVPDAPLDSPIRSFSASDYSVHRSRAGVGIRVSDAKPIAE
ncbi:MAG: hypothetical protein GC205_10730 [Bacteroidetes bacterium]|nr:hypothetical protein [Bacteroidota bacterium]